MLKFITKVLLFFILSIGLYAGNGLSQKHLVSVSPEDLALGQHEDTVIKIVFDEQIVSKSVKKHTIRLRYDKQKIEGVTTLVGENTLHFVPNEALTSGTYRVIVKRVKLDLNEEKTNQCTPKGGYQRFVYWLCSLYYDNPADCPLCQYVCGNNGTKVKTKKIKYTFIVDETPPVITLNGENNINLIVGDDYEELGASAVDDLDGNVSVSISGEVDTSAEGNYTVTYTAVDKSGNSASETRRVIVENPVPKAKRIGIVFTKEYTELDTTNQDTIALKGKADSDIGIESVSCENETTKEILQVTGASEWSIEVVSLENGDNVITCEVVSTGGGSTAEVTRIITYFSNSDFNSSFEFVEDFWFPEEEKSLEGHVRFNATLSADAELTVYEVDANGTMLSEVSSMFDNGEGSDEAASDGIYSADFIVDKSELGTYCYRVGITKAGEDEYLSNIDCIYIVNHISDEAWSDYDVINDNIEQIRNENSDNATTSQKIYEMLKIDSKVVELSLSENGNIAYVTAEGIMGLYAPRREGVKASPMKDAMIISPYIDNPIDPDNFGTYDDYYAVWKDIKTATSGYFAATTEKLNDGTVAIGIDDFKDMTGHGYIHISTHGDNYTNIGSSQLAKFGLNSSLAIYLTVPILYTGYTFTSADRVAYEKDLKSQRIVLNGNFSAITPSFVMRYTKLSPYSIVVMSACRSAFLGDADLARVFLFKGASTVVGYTDYVSTSYAQDTTKMFLAELYSGKSTGDSFNATILKYIVDSPKATKYNVEEARFLMYGSKTLVLKSQICSADYFQYYNTGTLDELLKIKDKDVGVSNGDKHQVKELQEFLVAHGFDLGNTGANNDGIDGWFGKSTEDAIKEFQKTFGLPETGEIDQATQDTINASCYDKIKP